MTTSASRSRAASHPRLCGHVPAGHPREGLINVLLRTAPPERSTHASAALRVGRTPMRPVAFAVVAELVVRAT